MIYQPIIPAFEFDAQAFKKAVKAVAPAAAKHDTRPVLACVHLHAFDDGSVVVEAADGFRAIQKYTGCGIGNPAPVLLYTKPLAEITKKIKRDSKRVQIITGRNESRVIIDGVSFDCLTDWGVFPTLEQVYSTTILEQITVPTAELRSAVNEAIKEQRQFEKENKIKRTSIQLRLEVLGKVLLVENEMVNYSASVNLQAMVSHSVRHVEAQYLLDAVNAQESAKMTLKFGLKHGSPIENKQEGWIVVPIVKPDTKKPVPQPAKPEPESKPILPTVQDWIASGKKGDFHITIAEAAKNSVLLQQNDVSLILADGKTYATFAFNEKQTYYVALSDTLRGVPGTIKEIKPTEIVTLHTVQPGRHWSDHVAVIWGYRYEAIRGQVYWREKCGDAPIERLSITTWSAGKQGYKLFQYSNMDMSVEKAHKFSEVLVKAISWTRRLAESGS